MSAASHYTAVIEVSRTTTIAEERDRYDKVTTPASRDVAEVARIVVRADTLESLTAKAKAHLTLLEA